MLNGNRCQNDSSTRLPPGTVTKDRQGRERKTVRGREEDDQKQYYKGQHEYATACFSRSRFRERKVYPRFKQLESGELVV